MNIDVILPCYNPVGDWAQNIIKSIRNLEEKIPNHLLNVYLINDGSTRGIEESDLALLNNGLKSFSFISYSKNKGKGFALRQGVLHASSNLCIFTDIDFPYTEESFINIYKELSLGNYDIVVGIRDENYYSTVPKTRVKISKTLRFITRSLLDLPVTDTQAGLKGFNRNGQEIFLNTTINRYLFDLEFLFEANKNKNIRIKGLSVNLKPDIIFSKMSPKILLEEGLYFSKIFIKHLVKK